MKFRLDSGKFPSMDPNKVLAKSRKVLAHPPMNPTTNINQVRGIYKVCQYMNSPIDIIPVAKENAKDGSRRGLI